MEMMKKDYCDKMQKLKGLVDQVADSVEFLKVSGKLALPSLQDSLVKLLSTQWQHLVKIAKS